MSRGIVIWPDAESEAAIHAIWSSLAAAGLPSLSTHSHRQHRPHVSLVVGATLDPAAAALGTGAVPAEPVPFDCPSIGVFPGTAQSDGRVVLYLAVTPSRRLLAEHRRVISAAGSLVEGRWPFFELDGWMPHITFAYGIAPEQLSSAIGIVNRQLPLAGTFTSGGVEDGDTAERWPLS